MRYEINYGYLPGTTAADGNEIDAYIIGVAKVVDRFEGQCIAVIQRFDDVEGKLVVVPFGKDLSDEDIRKATLFQEQFFRSKIVRRR